MTPAEQKLLKALIHGMSSPEEILARPGLSSKLVALLQPLVGQFDESLQFKQTYNALKEKPSFDHLVVSDRVELTELELAYLFKLAELGVKIRFEFPTDESGQGFSLAVSYLAQKIEKRHDLKNLELVFRPFQKPARWARFEAPDLVQEARLIAGIITAYKPGKTIAVAMRTLDRRALIFENIFRTYGLDIKITPLPELLGKQFDLVVIADAAHGRVTLSREPDWPLTDSDCFEINHLMGRPILRRFEEDPLEPSHFSARQALEPMWFLGACDAARELLLVTSSLLDDKYQAQAPSELTKLAWLGEPEDISKLPKAQNKLEQVFESAKKNPSPTSTHNFHLDKARFMEKFHDKLGFSEKKPLSATRIEAFAQCRFRAFIEKLLEVDLSPAPAADTPPRLLGQIAHAVLERYYSSDQAIEQALQQESKQLLTDNPHLHIGVWNAMMTWLSESLTRLVSNLEKNPVISNAKPVAFEKKLGPMPFQIGSEQIFLGGVADRVDQSPDTNIIVDYKLSSLSSLRMRFAPNEILKTQFQIPIYLKLLQHAPHSIGYPISVKDGAPGPLIDMTGRFEELDLALLTLLKPVLEGYVPADIQEACTDCRLKRLCRV